MPRGKAYSAAEPSEGWRKHRRAAIGVLAGLITLAAAASVLASTTPRTPVERAPSRLEAEEQRAIARFLRLGLPLRCGGDRGRDVALTFDDGPGPYTALALRILRRAHAKATFFLVGKELAYWPGLPRRELALGALGDHTWTHPLLPGLSDAAIRTELATTQNAIEKETGARVQLFRPPYGAHDARVDREARALGMVEVLWSIDSRDSEGAPWYQIADNVAHSVRPGSIILLHENRGQTIRALYYRILSLLYARRLVPVTVPALLALDPPTPSQIRAGPSGCSGNNPAYRGSRSRHDPASA